MKTKKNRARGGGLPPPRSNRNRNQCFFLSFGVDPLNWQSFVEIGEMTCSTIVLCSRGYTLNALRSYFGPTFFSFRSDELLREMNLKSGLKQSLRMRISIKLIQFCLAQAFINSQGGTSNTMFTL